MIDPTSIGPAIESVLHMYFRFARGSGRSETLYSNITETDAIVCLARDATRIKNDLYDHGFRQVRILVCEPHISALSGFRIVGTMYFDHSWLEEFYLANITSMTNALTTMQTKMSGHGFAINEIASSLPSSTTDSILERLDLGSALLSNPTSLLKL